MESLEEISEEESPKERHTSSTPSWKLTAKEILATKTQNYFAQTKRAENILIQIAFSIGLSSIWRFPYLCHLNGGDLSCLQTVTHQYFWYHTTLNASNHIEEEVETLVLNLTLGIFTVWFLLFLIMMVGLKISMQEHLKADAADRRGGAASECQAPQRHPAAAHPGLHKMDQQSPGPSPAKGHPLIPILQHQGAEGNEHGPGLDLRSWESQEVKHLYPRNSLGWVIFLSILTFLPIPVHPLHQWWSLQDYVAPDPFGKLMSKKTPMLSSMSSQRPKHHSVKSPERTSNASTRGLSMSLLRSLKPESGCLSQDSEKYEGSSWFSLPLVTSLSSSLTIRSASLRVSRQVSPASINTDSSYKGGETKEESPKETSVQ